MVTETETSHDLTSESWRTRKTCCVVQSEFKALRMQEEIDALSPGLIQKPKDKEYQSSKVRDDGCLSWSREKGHDKLALFGHLVLFGLAADWMPNLHWWRRSSLLSLLLWRLISSRNTLTDTSWYVLLLIWHPVA